MASKLTLCQEQHVGICTIGFAAAYFLPQWRQCHACMHWHDAVRKFVRLCGLQLKGKCVRSCVCVCVHVCVYVYSRMSVHFPSDASKTQ